MKDNIKVIFIARRFPPSVGGMERFAYDLSNALEARAELNKITWGGSNKWLPLVLPIFFIRAFLILLKERDIRVIHMQDAVQAPIGWLLHVIFQKPYIVVAHGLDITYKSAFYQSAVLPFVRKADAVISISTATNDEAVARGVDPEKTRVITLGTHDDYGEPRSDRAALSNEIGGEDLEDRQLLLTTGRLVKRKGVAWFIQSALPSIVQGNPSVLYLVAGDGEERSTIERSIKNAGMHNYVRMLGRVSDETRSLLYQTCDIFVMPNIKVQGDMEGFGIVAHEAATAGLPVVASGIEGIADALHDGKNGILLPSGDQGAYIEAITRLLKDDKYRLAVGTKARNYTLQAFSWGTIARQYMEVYEKVCDKRR